MQGNLYLRVVVLNPPEGALEDELSEVLTWDIVIAKDADSVPPRLVEGLVLTAEEAGRVQMIVAPLPLAPPPAVNDPEEGVARRVPHGGYKERPERFFRNT